LLHRFIKGRNGKRYFVWSAIKEKVFFIIDPSRGNGKEIPWM
jgi:hypothetical protein